MSRPPSSDIDPALPRLAIARLCLLAGVVSASSATSIADFAVPADKAAFHIFLLAGQSNMAGRGEVAPIEPVHQRRARRGEREQADTELALRQAHRTHDTPPRRAQHS